MSVRGIAFLFCALLVAVMPGRALAECPMSSPDGRFVLVQEAVEALGGQWVTTRILYDRGKDAKGKPAKIYTAEDMTQERPDLDYVQRSLKTRLKEHGVAASCLADVGAKRSGFKVKKRGCTIEVSVEGKALGKAKLDFGEPAMHGADPCAAEFEVKWYALPKASGYLLEVDAVEGDDPAMGRFTLGTTHAIFR